MQGDIDEVLLGDRLFATQKLPQKSLLWPTNLTQLDNVFYSKYRYVATRFPRECCSPLICFDCLGRCVDIIFQACAVL